MGRRLTSRQIEGWLAGCAETGSAGGPGACSVEVLGFKVCGIDVMCFPAPLAQALGCRGDDNRLSSSMGSRA